MTTGIMSAMPQEAQRLAHALKREREHTHGGRTYYTGTLEDQPVVLVYSRIGKVAAAATAQHLIDIHRVTRILFTGVAGALAPGLSVGDIVIADHLWQHDMDASPLFPQLEIPLLGISRFPADRGLSTQLRRAAESFLREDFAASINRQTRADLRLHTPRIHTGDIASGDRFVSTTAERDALRAKVPTALCVEMEGAAVAQVCHEQQVPLAVARIISDSADDHASVDFNRFIVEAASLYGLGIVRRHLAAT